MADEVTAPDDELEVGTAPEAVESDVAVSDAPESSASPAEGGSAEAAPTPYSRLAGMFGLETPDEDQIIGKLGQFQQTYQQTLRQAEQAAYYQRRLQEVEARQHQAAQVPAPQAQAAPAKPKWDAPEFDPRWLNLVERDANNRLVAVPGADPMLPEKIRKYTEWKSQQEQKFFANPTEFVGNVYGDQVQQLVKEQINSALEARFSQQQVNQNAQSFLQQNAYWMISTDPITGQEDLSHYGRIFRDSLVEADQYQIRDPQARQQFAMARVQAIAAQHQVQAQATPAPAEVQARKNAELLKGGATRRMNRSGNTPRVGAEPTLPNGDLNLKAMLRKELADFPDAEFSKR